MASWIPYALTAAVLVVVAATGIYATDVGPWYRELNKPSWNPPDWLFGPVWTTIYVLIATSVGRVWPQVPEEARGVFLFAFGLNAVLNILWSFLFFKWRRPDIALYESFALWLSVLSLVVLTGRHDALSGALLLPYLVWVGIATYLTLTIVRLNPGYRPSFREPPASPG